MTLTTLIQKSSTEYTYQTAEEGDVVGVSLRYNKDYYRQRGIHIHITPWKIERQGNFQVKTTLLFGDLTVSGARFFVKALERQNNRELRAVAETLDGVVKEVAARWMTEPQAAAKLLQDCIRATFGPPIPPTPPTQEAA